MVSLLEQYETETQQTDNFGTDSTDLNNPVKNFTTFSQMYLNFFIKVFFPIFFQFRTGFINASLNKNENEEIFKSQRVQIK